MPPVPELSSILILIGQAEFVSTVGKARSAALLDNNLNRRPHRISAHHHTARKEKDWRYIQR